MKYQDYYAYGYLDGSSDVIPAKCCGSELVEKIIEGAPEELDTFKEVADAMKDIQDDIPTHIPISEDEIKNAQ